ncbi:hypothetical protein [Sphaerisporangium album]|uniref:hypothetical protein n=1 Tax=Sphaerisporangium album TaxID=509200 RepID=UPI0011C03643|nr:hypothetical protein [Sphaerisporangium album]
MPGFDIDQVPADALPGLAERCGALLDQIALHLAFNHQELKGARPVIRIGTSVGDTWSIWHPPTPEPPVPR